MGEGVPSECQQGGAACCSATGCLGSCYVNCGHGSHPLPYQPGFRLTCLKFIRLGFIPEVGHVLQTSGWVIPTTSNIPT